MLRRPHDHHRDLPTRLLTALPSGGTSPHHQDRHFMRRLTLRPPRTVVRCSCWSSTGYASARPSDVPAPQLPHLSSLLDLRAPQQDRQIVHFSGRHQRMLSVSSLGNTPLAALKAPSRQARDRPHLLVRGSPAIPPAVSSLGGFRIAGPDAGVPRQPRRARAGIRKPSQLRKSPFRLLCQLSPAADIESQRLKTGYARSDIRGPTTTRYFRDARRKKVLPGSFSVRPMRSYARPTNAASCTFATSGLRLQAHAARTDQARIGRLEAPEGPADRAFEVNVLIIGAAEGKVSRQHVAVRNRYKTDDDAARVDFDDAAEPGHLGPQIALDVVMDPVRAPIPRAIGACFDTLECQVQRILLALRAAHRRTGGKQGVPHPPAGTVADRQRAIVRRDGDPIREQASVHHLAQDAVARILVNCAAAVRHVWPGTGCPRIGEEQVPLGVEIEIVGAFKQLIAVGIDQRFEFFGFRIVDQNAAVAGG